MLAVMQNRTRVSSAALLLANLAPLAGVLLLGWSVSSVVILYWFENIVLGLLNAARMLVATPAADQMAAPDSASADAVAAMPGIAAHGAKVLLIPFFLFHYFFFCAGHGVFVFGMFPDDDGFFTQPDSFEMLATLFQAVEIFATPLAWAAAALLVSHLVSFVVNYIGGEEYRRFGPQQLMMQPYRRIVVLHLTIIFGGFAVMALAQPVWLLVVMVAIKVAVDLKMHLREHRPQR